MNLAGKLSKLTIALSLLMPMGAFASVPLPGYGAKNQAVGEVSVAMPQDTFVMVFNPAGIAYLCDSLDMGISYLKPVDKVRIRDNALVASDHYKSTPDYPVPGFGIKKDFNSCIAYGAVAYGRGAGVNYGHEIPIVGTSDFKFNYKHYIFKPCLAWKFSENQAVGIGVNLTVGTLENYGTQNFRPLSIDPDHVSNKTLDYRAGAGVHIGWIGRFFEKLKLGASFETKIYMAKFKKYRGLLADHCRADGPSILSLGVSYDLTCDLTIGFDYQRLFWSDLPYVANHITFTEPLGSRHGAGLGWKDENKFKVGLVYRATDSLTLRFGYQRYTALFAPSQILTNLNSFVVPGHYVSGGFSWALGCHHEFSFAYSQGLNRTVKGTLPDPVGGGEVEMNSTIHLAGAYYTYHF